MKASMRRKSEQKGTNLGYTDKLLDAESRPASRTIFKGRPKTKCDKLGFFVKQVSVIGHPLNDSVLIPSTSVINSVRI